MEKRRIQQMKGNKTFDLKAIQGANVTPEILAKINKYSLRPLSAEEVFVRRYLMAHNAVDRDNERFPEALLDDFANTLPGKSLLNGHNRLELPLGLYFDASTEEMTPEQFKALTGEDPNLPDNVQMVKVLWGWVYMLKADFTEALAANIDAGIYRHASIGFRASDTIPVKGAFNNVLFYEYVSPGEALEGSIVWLGAQQGATAQKGNEYQNERGGKMDYTKDNPLDPNRKERRRAADCRIPDTAKGHATKCDYTKDNPLDPNRGKKKDAPKVTTDPNDADIYVFGRSGVEQYLA
jgi:hypothetical protein